MRIALTLSCLVLGLAGGSAPADGNAPAPLTTAAAEAAATRPIAYIYGNIPITRQDLGDFLIARGGYEKLELLVNKRIIETECNKRGVTVTETEMEAALAEDVAGLSIKKEDFIRVVLPRYGKTYYEWMEDVIRPRLQLTKLCRDRVQVTEADLRKQFEREFGEKRRVQMILWNPNTDLKRVQELWGKLRSTKDASGKIVSDQEEFDRQARTQENVALAASTGHIKPISRHLPAQEETVERTAFSMTPGEVSGIIHTGQGYLVMKLHEIIPPATNVKFEDVKPRLEKQALDERISEEIPKFFAELKAQAKPDLFGVPIPAQWQFSQPTTADAKEVLQGVVPASAMGQPGERK